MSAFSTRWQSAIDRWQQRAAKLKGLAVVTHHQDWRYLFDWLDMRQLATLEPKPGLSPGSAYLSGLLTQFKRTPPALIVRAAYQDARPSQWLAQRSNIPAVSLPYTVGGSELAIDLFGLFDDTLNILLSALDQ